MKNVLLHTPEGVRDIYNKECERKEYLQQKIHMVLKKYGYHDMATPTFEFFDIFSKEKGTVESRQMYKFFDREGNTLVLRPDMTPPMARCVAKYYMEETMPIRLCYAGQSFINSAEHQGKLKERTQIGAELYGENNADADVETLVMMIEGLLDCGLKEFQIEVGHALFFEGLLEEAELPGEEEEVVRNLVENKNFFSLEEYLWSRKMKPDLKAVFLNLSQLNGSGDMLARAKNMISNRKTEESLERLEQVYKLLVCYGYEKYVSFDLSILASRNYYTGIIFAGYTYGTGDAIATGGRYDNLVKQFGKDTPSIGFAIDLDRLLLAMSRQKLEIPVEENSIYLLYENGSQKEAIDMAGEYRREGMSVTLVRRNADFSMECYQEYAGKMGFCKMYYIRESGSRAEKIELE